MRLSPFLAAALLSPLLLFAGGAAGEQAAPTDAALNRTTENRTTEFSASGGQLSEAAIDERIKLLEGYQSQDEALKAQLLELLILARGRLADARSNEAAAQGFKAALAAAPKQAAQIRAEIQAQTGIRPDSLSGLDVNSDIGLSELRQRLLEEQSRTQQARAVSEQLDKRLTAERSRPNAARQALSAARQRIAAIEAELKELSNSADQDARLSEARRFALLARRWAQQTEAARLDQELLSHEARLGLLIAERDRAVQQLRRRESAVKLLEDFLSERRNSQAARARADAEQARAEAIDKHPAIRELAEQTAAFSSDLQKMVQALDETRQRRQHVAGELKRLSDSFTSVRRKLDVAGLSPAMNALLLDERRRLPDRRFYQAQAKERLRELSAAGLGRLRAEEHQRRLIDLDDAVEAWIGERLERSLSPATRYPIGHQVRFLMVDQQALVNELVEAYSSYTQLLGDLDFDQQRLVEETDRYQAFLDKQLLWIPSAPVLGATALGQAAVAASWFSSPGEWRGVMQAAKEALDNTPALWAGFAPIALLLIARRRFSQHLDKCAERVGRLYADRFSFTLEACAVSVLMAIPWPALFAYVGWIAANAPAASDFARTVGLGLMAAARPLLMLLVLRTLCIRNGVCRAHFLWSERTVALIRIHLYWFAPITVAASFVIATSVFATDEAVRQSLGRIALLLAELALAIFTYRLLSPSHGAPRDFIATKPDSWLARLRFMWFPLAVGLPLCLAAMAVVGYAYTAMALQAYINTTVWIVVGAVLLYGLILRWLWTTTRRLELEREYERRITEREKTTHEQAEHEEDDPASADERPKLDLKSIDLQTRRLVSTLLSWSVVAGLWLVWADVLPALSGFDNIDLWQQAAVRDGQLTLIPVTFSDIALAMLAGIVAFAAARNLPGVLELAVLRHLPIDAGARHALTATAQYLIAGIGIVIVFDLVGLDWSDIQWLVAALSVGLGFGLQEIVANFVSGLIILFERPIRIGDTVTVGNLSGTVTRIRIRATTLTDWDNKEIIVPNKTFITERLINWTLTDAVTRVVIHVGIAYGSDTVKAHTLMLQAATDHPAVLSEPEPQVFFVGLGDSSLNFEVRLYVRTLAERLSTTHEYLMAIERTLSENGIDIPFPQRELHIRSERIRNWPGTAPGDSANPSA
ncbi:MAG: mechanosensitive ion channel [Gammaproteobacteria bacterium]|nr:mechanosensitive ion channel [Gammaproteobacteria bacterium]